MNARKRSAGKISLLLWIMIGLCVCYVPYSIMYKVKQSEYSGMGGVTRLEKSKTKFHVVVTASNTVYSNWQMRIMYYWYKKVKESQDSDMGGFTRVLHTGKPDNLMDEIPTFVVDPIPYDLAKGYVVLNRPWAFVQWLARAEIEEEYIFMGEPDHIFVKPLPNLSLGSNPVAYPFFYIRPTKFEHLLRKLYPKEMGPITNIDPIGNSPVILKKSLLMEIAPTWVNISVEIRNDLKMDKALGWVQEMYAYALASALHGVKHTLNKDLITQPPYDLEKHNYIIHYTYACDYSIKGEFLYDGKGYWNFDKRNFIDNPIPKNFPMPPKGVPQNTALLMKMLNEATSNIPNWDSPSSPRRRL